ncbi:hypothetical protein [Aeromicrobium sp. IC_218]|uniref:hypothetical protein n=1 Tax=Aeromicrobium sp. IC_218 TaxID=2545468 RepID=UPI001039CA6F|nr:hypothetical protein [Aeromicrobium sp. IC_218]TCI96397.1 hypothetical protein E0W78_14785 [Aeromicrobium sp. IC_218]
MDDLQGASTMAVTSAARAAESLLRASQDRALRRGAQTSQEADDAQRRYETQATVAEQFYRRAATADFVRDESTESVVNAWRGAQEWSQRDPARFGPHAVAITKTILEVRGVDLADPDRGEQALEELREQVRVEGGVDIEHEHERQDDGVDREAVPGLAADLDYDSTDARRARAEQIEASDLAPEVKTALKITDNQQGHDPALSARAGRGREKATDKGRAASHDRARRPPGLGR